MPLLLLRERCSSVRIAESCLEGHLKCAFTLYLALLPILAIMYPPCNEIRKRNPVSCILLYITKKVVSVDFSLLR